MASMVDARESRHADGVFATVREWMGNGRAARGEGRVQNEETIRKRVEGKVVIGVRGRCARWLRAARR